MAQADYQIRWLKAEVEQLRRKNMTLTRSLHSAQARARAAEARLSLHERSGLPTRPELERHLTSLLQGNASGTMGLALLRLDEHFAILQRALRPSMTEWVLYEMGNRIRGSVGAGAAVYHLRDEEFALVFETVDSEGALEILLSGVIQQVRAPVTFPGYQLAVGCNVGVALCRREKCDKTNLLRKADLALNDARQSPAAIRFFASEMRSAAVERVQLQADILSSFQHHAENGHGHQFSMRYQPIIRVDPDPMSGRVLSVGVEALVRWRQADGSVVGPDRFIPVAEETGLILPIGNWVLYRVARDIEAWREDGVHLESVNVNLSARQLLDPQLVDTLGIIADRFPETRNRIVLELTETSIMERPEEAVERMREIVQAGYEIAIDDFGTGYSSLNYLRSFPTTCFKIDRSFVSNMTQRQQDRAIIRTICSLASDLGYRVIAEGVETEAELMMLQAEGCDSFQGYLFGRPMPADEVPGMIADLDNRAWREAITLN